MYRCHWLQLSVSIVTRRDQAAAGARRRVYRWL